MASQNFGWASSNAALAAAAGTCSVFMSSGDDLIGNQAQAGGAIYSTNMTSLQLSCSPNVSRPSLSAGCPSWSGNVLHQVPPVLGYGPVLAFPPARMVLSQTTVPNYTSDGTPLMPFSVQVLDQADTLVSTGRVIPF